MLFGATRLGARRGKQLPTHATSRRRGYAKVPICPTSYRSIALLPAMIYGEALAVLFKG